MFIQVEWLMLLTPQVTLSEEQTCTLMSCLEEICLSEFSDAEASLEVRSTPCVNVALRCIRHGPVLSIHLALYKLSFAFTFLSKVGSLPLQPQLLLSQQFPSVVMGIITCVCMCTVRCSHLTAGSIITTVHIHKHFHKTFANFCK